jgi:hypothetical protein
MDSALFFLLYPRFEHKLSLLAQHRHYTHRAGCESNRLFTIDLCRRFARRASRASMKHLGPGILAEAGTSPRKVQRLFGLQRKA